MASIDCMIYRRVKRSYTANDPDESQARITAGTRGTTYVVSSLYIALYSHFLNSSMWEGKFCSMRYSAIQPKVCHIVIDVPLPTGATQAGQIKKNGQPGQRYGSAGRAG
jgi:hypothetical protein